MGIIYSHRRRDKATRGRLYEVNIAASIRKVGCTFSNFFQVRSSCAIEERWGGGVHKWILFMAHGHINLICEAFNIGVQLPLKDCEVHASLDRHCMP